MRKPGAPRNGAFADLIEAFHGVSRQRLHLRADSDGILAAFRLRAVKEARSARSCDRCGPGDRLVGAQRRDATGLFVVWICAFHGGGIGAVCLLFAGFSLSHARPADEVEAGRTIPVWAFAAAALVTLSSGGDYPAEIFRRRSLTCGCRPRAAPKSMPISGRV
jgi:hypothetical protein